MRSFIAKSQMERVTWESNIKAFETLTKPMVTRPKEGSKTQKLMSLRQRYKPLYIGSQVCFGTSSLQNPFHLHPFSTEIAHEVDRGVGTGLHDDDIPAIFNEFRTMLSKGDPELMGWAQSKKRRL